MPDPRDATNTKVERLTEALEAMMTAIYAKVTHNPKGSIADVKDARTECAAALHELLKPVLRVAAER